MSAQCRHIQQLNNLLATFSRVLVDVKNHVHRHSISYIIMTIRLPLVLNERAVFFADNSRG